MLAGHTIAYDLAALAREHALAGLAWWAPPALEVRLARLASPGLMHDDLVHGDLVLRAALLDEARGLARTAPDFFKLLAVQAAGWRAPLVTEGRV